jgi:hypothetical protein
MAQHDYVIANGTGAAVRSDLNNGLSAIVTQNSGATEPATTYAFMRWADTTAGVMKMRNSANNAWITLYQLDGEWTNIAFENGTAAAPSIYFKDSGTDTGFYSPGANQVGISTGGTAALVIDSSQRVGLGTSSPGALLTLAASVPEMRLVDSDNSLYGTITAPGGDIYIDADKSNGAGGSIIRFAVDDVERARIDSSGRLGIGTTSPGEALTVGTGNAQVTSGQLTVGVTSTSGLQFINDGTFGTLNSIPLIFRTVSSERARIDTSGRLLVGTSSSINGDTVQIAGSGPALGIGRFVASVSGPDLNLFKSRSGTVGTNTVVQSGDILGNINFNGGDGTNYITAALIRSEVDGTPGANDMPGRLVFSTTKDGQSSPTERMRIINDGSILIQQTALSSASDGCYFNAGTPANFHQLLCHSSSTSTLANLYLNRQASDGTLIDFRQADTSEGVISVSGTTVSLVGGHIARWSQLPNNGDPSELLKGTVMSNLDEMCEWGEEDNEQLNKSKVSDVEGDPHVAGVFVSTAFSDEGPLDFYLAMTGDMIIRIAEGVTVQRGDLLMSAGDGTAKPQDDDIVRSKTVAKVTSTHVTCTYDDGSYCVPCVLMAC